MNDDPKGATRHEFLQACTVGAVFPTIGALTSNAAAARPPNSSVVAKYIDRNEIAGAVTLVATKDEVLAFQAFGYADIAKKRQMRTDALFWIASMSKPITASAFMMLVDEGKVQLDDPVTKYLPNFTPQITTISSDWTTASSQKPQTPITIRQLLSHTSGLPGTSTVETPTLDRYHLSARVASYAFQPLLFEPGTDWMYANAGVNTAAHIIEVISGISYEEFLQTRLFDPLGMTQTTFWPSPAQVENLAKSYEPNEYAPGLQEVPITQLSYPLTDRSVRFPVPAGGLFSTGADLGKFCQMILNRGTVGRKRYLTESAVAAMHENEMPEKSKKLLQGQWLHGEADTTPIGYGLGWSISPQGAFGHGGAYSTEMRIDPGRGLATLLLIQLSDTRSNGYKCWFDFNQAVAKEFA